MGTIKRGTTPTHIFTIPIDSSEIANCAVIYQQYGKNLFQIPKASCTISTGTLSVTLTQAQTLQFTAGINVEIEIILETTAGKCLRSNIINAVADKTLLGEEFI